MIDLDIHDLANSRELRRRVEVRIADTAQFIAGGGGNQALKPSAELALINPAGEVPRFIWSIVLNPDTQNHYNGTAVLPEGDANTPGSLTYLLNFIVSSKIPTLWA